MGAVAGGIGCVAGRAEGVEGGFAGAARTAALAVALGVAFAVALAGLAAGPAAAYADAWLVPVVDLDGRVLGAELAAVGPDGGAQLQAAVGWGFETRRWHYRLATLMDLRPTTELRLGWVDWADVTLLGQAREQGLFGEVVWEPTVKGRWSVRGFYGRVGTTADALESAVLYGHVRYDSWLVHRWPLSVRLRAELTYGQAQLPAGQGGQGSQGSQGGRGGPFGAVMLTLPVQVEYLRLIARAGYAAGEEALTGFAFQVGGYQDGWLRGYEPGQFKGPVLLGLNAEYRRAWLQLASVPLLSLLEVGPFVDLMAAGSDGASRDRLVWRTSYGLTAAVPLGVALVGLDAAWNDAGQFRPALRLSREF